MAWSHEFDHKPCDACKARAWAAITILSTGAIHLCGWCWLQRHGDAA
jgi:hypothetical protein